ncbi:MAG TPA: glycosyltransferase family 2 protein [Actinomycetes bacterium]|nr:glycosyltransferase family 2 protein [Actinomycetes bacterium]
MKPPAQEWVTRIDKALPKPKISVVIPTLNEARNLPHVFANLPDNLHEVVVVDGHSVDDSVGVARRLRPDVKIVMQQGNGKGDALASGFAASEGDIIVMLDADGSTDPAEIPRFVEVLLDGADFAKGSRFLVGGGSDDLTRIRRLGNDVLSRLVNLLFGTGYTDLCYGYNAFWSRCLGHVPVDCNGFEVEAVLSIRAAKAALVVREVASFEFSRIHGASNLHVVRDGWRVLRTILAERLSGTVPRHARPPSGRTLPSPNGQADRTGRAISLSPAPDPAPSTRNLKG